MRQKLVVGNWKMYKTQSEAESFFADLLPRVKDITAVKVWLAVPYTLIESSAAQTSGSHIVIGAQNMNDASQGAFTGEIAGRMLKEAGAQFVILGHSERRRLFNESDQLINRKVKRALECDLQPILCVGESPQERQQNKTFEVLETQLKAGLADIAPEQLPNIVVAYEPVWAIGTGETASPAQAQEVHAFIRKYFAGVSEDIPAQMTVIYGGSVQPDNAASLMDQPDIDGLLVGGASLSAELFTQILQATQTLSLGKEP